VKLDKGDRVIFSSRTIPGNEKEVGRVVNGLVRQGIEVITDRTHLVHVSGHPRRAEIEEMYGWVKPRIVVPVHGEALHLAEHAKIARGLGINEVVECQNGDLIRLAPGSAAIIDEVPAARLYKDGMLMIEAEGRTVPDRRRLGFAGIVSVALAVTSKGELATDPEVALTGIPPNNRHGEPFAQIAYDAVIDTFESLPRPRRSDPDALMEAVRGAVRSAIAVHWGKKPICHVQVLAL
jgi:ribonuclease J